MDRLTTLILCLLVVTGLAGCAAGPYGPPSAAPAAIVYHANPATLPGGTAEQVWEDVVDVVDDYFEIAQEIPISDTEPVGRLDTVPQPGATLFEPWRHDSANAAEKLESTLQTIRRQAVVHVSRIDRGYLVEVIVYKQLEAVTRPMMATSDAALLRNDGSLTRVVNPVTDVPIDDNWIPLGRDTALEQRILGQLLTCRPLMVFR